MPHTFSVEVSARHVHLSVADVERLFGEGRRLTWKRDLSQPGQFLSEERVDIVGPRNTLRNAAVLGPERPASQVELSLTDCNALGIPASVRESGDIQSTPGVLLIGPCAQLELPMGVIAAKRHVHMTPEDAKDLGVEDRQVVCVAVEAQRPLIFRDVVVRVSPQYRLAMHVDTDEANACGIPRGEDGRGSIVVVPQL